MAITSTLPPALPRAFLFRHRQSELDALFATLPVVHSHDFQTSHDLQTTYQGTLIGIVGLSWLPGIAKALLYRLLTTWINPWRGKRFAGAEGANRWGFGVLQGSWGRYRLIDQPDEQGVTLDYDVAANPRLLRPILGEVRRFQSGLYLARMRYRSRNGTSTLLYFTLQETH